MNEAITLMIIRIEMIIVFIIVAFIIATENKFKTKNLIGGI